MKILLILLFPCLLFSQNDTILVSYSPSDQGNGSRIAENLVLPNNQMGLLKKYNSKFELFTTDKYGETLKIDSIYFVEGYEILHCSFIHFSNENYYLAGSARKNGESYYISFQLPLNSPNSAQIIDTMHLETNEAITFEDIKFNPTFGLFETFGVLHTYQPGSWPIKANCYMALDEQFNFVKYKTFYGQYFNNYILTFFWNENAQRYWLTGFNLRAIILDQDLNVIKADNRIRRTYNYNNITYNASFSALGCFEHPDGGEIVCLGTKFFNADPWQVSFMRVSVQEDTIIATEVIPVNDPPLDIIQGTLVKEDSEGDVIVTGVDAITFGTTQNKMTIAKFSKSTYQRYWTLSFDTGRYFEPWDLDVDDDKNIVIVGRANLIGDGILRGFLLKIRPDGTVDTHENFPIDPNGYLITLYPNPTTGRICLKTDAPDASLYRIWDMSGRLVLELQDSNSTCITLPNSLTAGVYTAEIRLRDGQVAMRRFVVE